MDTSAFFTEWAPIGRVIVIGAAAYVALVLMLRVSGKRTLSKLNAFDFVVTVALGSTLATVITSKDLALAEGVAALGLLVALQFLISFSAVHWRAFERLVTSEPVALLRDGQPFDRAMRRERITEGELLASVRASGGASLAQAQTVFLESDGTLTAMLKPASETAAPPQAEPSSKIPQAVPPSQAVLSRNCRA